VRFDTIIIGGGIVGISTAWQLARRHPDRRVLLVEKEDRLGTHQTGHNSGVIHSGIYYRPGSLKARLCREGSESTFRFCRENGIPHEQRGKLLVATDETDLARMDSLQDRARENGIESSRLDGTALREREPHVAGLGALWVPSTGTVDFGRITEKMAELFRSLGGEVRPSAAVTGIEERPDEVVVRTSRGEVRGRHLIACAGLMADRVARMAGLRPEFAIVPFRGEYYRVAPDRGDLVHHLIYPIPDPDLPFLGVHLTPLVDGTVTVGPNAVLALAREGYRKTDISVRDLWEMSMFPGFWRVLGRNLGPGLGEMRDSMIKSGYVAKVRRYCPGLTGDDLLPHPAGVRAQAVARDGTLLHDFLFASTRRTVHVCNAPSPAATSAIPIGRHIINQADERLA